MKSVLTEKSAKTSLALLWGAGILILMMVVAKEPFVLLSRFSPEWFVIFAAYLGTGAFLIAKPNNGFAAVLHLLLISFLISLKVSGAFLGRDLVMALFFMQFVLVVLFFLQVRPQVRMLLFSVTIGLFLANYGAGVAERVALRKVVTLPDYGDIPQGGTEGGMLHPNLDFKMLGEFGVAHVITNPSGFRRQEPVSYERPAGTFRVLLLGDSVVVGYRTDQNQTIGFQLEDELRKRHPGKKIEVLIAGENYPSQYRNYLKTYALKFHPDLVIVGLTLGNDLYPGLPAKFGNGIREEIIGSKLPPDAYRKGHFAVFLTKLHWTYMKWDLYQLGWKVFFLEKYPIWGSVPFGVSVFDGNNTLGALYTRAPLDNVQKALDTTTSFYDEMNQWCRENNIDFMGVFFPQAFQVKKSLWTMLEFEYGLDPHAFDWNEPQATLAREFTGRKINFFDPLETLRAGKKNYFFIGEMHFNASGQAAVARALADVVETRHRL